MRAHDRKMRYQAEFVAACFSACSFVLMLLDPQWIETLVARAPDGGDGRLEGLVLLSGAIVATGIAALLAQGEKRRQRAPLQTR